MHFWGIKPWEAHHLNSLTIREYTRMRTYMIDVLKAREGSR